MATRWRMPPKYQGRVLPLRNLDTLDRVDGLFREYPLYRQYGHMCHLFSARRLEGDTRTVQLVVRAYSTLLLHFTGEKVTDYFTVDYLPAGVRARAPQYSHGVNVGPYCFVADSGPVQFLKQLFIELGYGMFPSEDRFAAQVGACFVARVFWRKLSAELSMFGVYPLNIASSASDYAKRLLDREELPTDKLSYGFSTSTLAWMPRSITADRLGHVAQCAEVFDVLPSKVGAAVGLEGLPH